MLLLVLYDITNDKKGTKLFTFLEGYGRRVQFSVFECFLSLEEMRQLYENVKKLVKPAEDNVRFYWIPQEAFERVLRDFQIKKIPEISCGAGVSPATSIGRAGTPVPQDG